MKLFPHFLIVLLLATAAHADVTFTWVKVGDPGNSPDLKTNYGKVDYLYEIGAFDVTNAQYAEFLNTVDPEGKNTLQLWNPTMSSEVGGSIPFDQSAPTGSKYLVKQGLEKRPVAYGTFFSALRFINWLNNGQGKGDTETGAYTLEGGTPIPTNWQTVTRSPGAAIYLSSEDEWYKAAYYQGDGTYTLFPCGNIAPTAVKPTSAPNSANYDNAVGDYTDVGAYTGSPSHYGTFDQAGNIWNWNESLFGDGLRVIRGNAFVKGADQTSSTARDYQDPRTPGLKIGFRITRIAQQHWSPLSLIPSLISLLLLGVLCAVTIRILRKDDEKPTPRGV